MVDIYTETVVRRRPLPGGSALETVCKVMTFVNAFLGVGASLVFLIPAAMFGVAWYFVHQNAEVEFEYAHTNGDFDIDKVIANASRKRVVSVDLNRVDVIAPVGSPELERFQHLKVVDYSAKDPENPPYGMVCALKDGQKLLLLQLDGKMLAGLKKWMPSKVIE